MRLRHLSRVRCDSGDLHDALASKASSWLSVAIWFKLTFCGACRVVRAAWRPRATWLLCVVQCRIEGVASCPPCTTLGRIAISTSAMDPLWSTPHSRGSTLAARLLRQGASACGSGALHSIVRHRGRAVLFRCRRIRPLPSASWQLVPSRLAADGLAPSAAFPSL